MRLYESQPNLQASTRTKDLRCSSLKSWAGRRARCVKVSQAKGAASASTYDPPTIQKESSPHSQADSQHSASEPYEGSAGNLGKEQDKFDWNKAWFPVAIAEHLPTDRPTGIRLLGKGIVLWKDSSGAWLAYRDLCPHRLAPLSEGRVENGMIVCSYHGWGFQGEQGTCVQIPQADSDKVVQQASRSKGACCEVYPCQEEDGLLWVFGTPGSEGESLGKTTKRQTIPELTDGDSLHFPWFMRDLPYGADILLENVADPSHVPHSHHGVQGNRFKFPKMHMKPPEKLDAKAGFQVLSHEPEDLEEAKRNPRMPYTISFGPPSLIKYQYNLGGQLISHATPTDPGRSRIFFTVSLKKDRASKMMQIIFKIMNSKWLEWKTHFTRNSVLDGDNVFLALQDKELHHRETRDWAANYFMPTTLDHGVKALRTWFSKLAQPFPWAPGALPAASSFAQSRRQMLNRYEQHTKHCPSCSAAHKVFSALRWIAGGSILLFTLVAAHALGNGHPWQRVILPSIAILVSAFVARTSHLNKLKFEFQDYRHPEH